MKFYQNLQNHSLRAILMFKECALSAQCKLLHNRRNASFGASTEGFVLSSQRKLSHYPMFLDRRNDSFGASTEEFALSAQHKLLHNRRNASFGASTEGFALSSQRKLSHYPMFLDRRNDSFGASTGEFALSCTVQTLALPDVP